MPKNAVIFDVDGVLVDSYQPHFSSWVRLFDELGFRYDEEEFLMGFGRTSAEVLTDWATRHGVQLSPERIGELDDRKEKFYREIILANFVAVEGAADLIDTLHAAGFLLAVGSSGPRENVEVVMQRLERAHKFATLVSRADIVKGKPEPDVFLTAAARLGVQPAKCAVIEDAAAGIEAANRAEMTSIALVGTTNRDNLAAADLVVDSLRELTTTRIIELIDAACRGRY